MSRKTVAAKLDRTNKVCFHRIKESADKINELVMAAISTDPWRLYCQGLVHIPINHVPNPKCPIEILEGVRFM